MLIFGYSGPEKSIWPSSYLQYTYEAFYVSKLTVESAVICISGVLIFSGPKY